ncbi:MAG: DUF1684 domain-containing protein [Microbacterium sp.]|uniref:DUF1684 domain-containing protein n=1 Tax=Microbacterium sp. TaxID=51671 RepID=UPI003F7D8E91
MNAAHRRWIADRDAAVWAPHGIASLAATHWLDAVDREYDDLPGRWRADCTIAVGSDTPASLRLGVGDEARLGDRLLRAVRRDGALALRVWDPDAASRRGISTIVRAAYEPSRRVTGVFASRPQSEATQAVDGHRSDTVYDGVVFFELDGVPLELTVERDDDGSLFAAFADATAGAGSYRFRFLRVPPPDADSRVEIDLNRAYLPPCAFSDHYVCVFPPPGNRWSVPVASGELTVR